MRACQATPAATTPVLMSWSGGKDSCIALRDLLADGGFEVRALLTTITRDYGRISMHGVRRTLLERQAASLGLPLDEVLIPKEASNDDYEAAMGQALSGWLGRGVETVGFGDLYLQDIRAYRDALLARHAMTGLYPVWGRDTRRFIEDFIDQGFRAVAVCVDGEKLPPDFAGRALDAEFLADLPAGVDPCGENGEFHTFVFDGPIFEEPVRFEIGERVQRGQFWFCDLLPEHAAPGVQLAEGADKTPKRFAGAGLRTAGA